ncbi:MAG: hypothetical protein R3A48_00840 [Polyangiales bacterium]
MERRRRSRAGPSPSGAASRDMSRCWSMGMSRAAWASETPESAASLAGSLSRVRR